MKNSTTSERLNSILKELNLRPVDLVNKCQPYCKEHNVKMGRNDISQYLSGKVEPSQKKLSILAKVLNTNEVWLMGYDVPMSIDANVQLYSFLNNSSNKNNIINRIDKLSLKQLNVIEDYLDFILQNKNNNDIKNSNISLLIDKINQTNSFSDDDKNELIEILHFFNNVAIKSIDEKIIFLETLLKKNAITKEDFNKQKNDILNDYLD